MSWVAYIMEQTGRFGEAEALYDALEFRSKDPAAAAFGAGGRAWLSFLRGDREGFAKAVAEGRAKADDPGNFAAYDALVAALAGHRDQAKRHLTDAVASKSLHAGGICAASATALELGEPEIA